MKITKTGIALLTASVFSLFYIMASDAMAHSHSESKLSTHSHIINSHGPEHVAMTVVKSAHNVNKERVNTANQFAFEPNLPADKRYTYIVQFHALAVAQAPDAAAQLRKTKQARRMVKVNNTRTPNYIEMNTGGDVARQLQKVTQQQAAFLNKSAAMSIALQPLARFKYGINGMAIEVTQAQAQQLSSLSSVKSIQRERTRTLNTDRGPMLIGAPMVWDGTAFSGISQTLGEGIIIAIVDSGINTNHPSFAEVAGDGYVHTNPLGDGNFLGDCAGNFAQLCNNKLIGVYSYPDITNSYSDTSIFPPNLPRNGEDYGGHGSHVAGIAAGNILRNVDEVFPTIGETRSSGTPTGFSFDQISGVAPRANIISYQVCFGGTKVREDTYADCRDSAILKAIDDAIADNVDIINYSISGGNNPWSDPNEQAFLSAQNAGIFVAVSAGNEGPQATTSLKTAPWYTSVAASEHGRENVYSKQLTAFTGGASALNAMLGQSNTGSLTAAIVYAGDFSNPNDPSGDSAQCLEPFPANTFNGQIVVCERGDIARVQKAINVRDGGAGGYVLVNVQGSESFLANDQYVIPGIHLNAANGDDLIAWVRTGVNHTATITNGEPIQVIDDSRVDVVAPYSSRGPNSEISTLVPTMTAPGSNIFAAYADEQLGHDGHEPAASDFITQNGTSMSSPHVAGAAALLKAAKPQWGPDEIRSALALTATTFMKKDGDTNATSSLLVDADFFDMGSGRIQVAKAIASGLVMNETAAAYANADPTLQGDPRTLNLPSITDNNCAGICTWSRTFTATTDATFTYEPLIITPNLTVSAAPASFTLLPGQSQTVDFTIDTLQVSKTEYSFALARFTSPGLPDMSLPVSVRSSIGNFPLNINIEAQRDSDAILIEDVDTIALDSFTLTTYKPVKASQITGFISADSNSSNYLDDTADGVSISTISVGEDAKRLVVNISETSAVDLDLFVLFDEDGNGQPSIFEEIAASRFDEALDEIQINYPKAGTYFIVVQNFIASANNTDSFDMRYAVVTNELALDALVANVPSATAENIPFDLGLSYQLPPSQSNDQFYAAIAIGTVFGDESIGLISVDIDRVDNDVFIQGTPTRLSPSDNAALSVRVKANPSNVERRYRISLPVPVGTAIASFDTSSGGQIANNEIQWIVDKPAADVSDTVLNFTLEALAGAASGPVIIKAKSELLSLPFDAVQTSETFSAVQIEGSPVISFSNNNSTQFTVTETQTFVLPLVIDEPNNDNVTLSFVQTSGPDAPISQQNEQYSLAAPQVEADTQLVYEISAADTNNNVSTIQISVTVLNNGSPIITAINAPTSAPGGSSVTISIEASDPENDVIQLQINGRAFSGTSTTVTVPSTGATVRYVISASDGITQTDQTFAINLTQAQSNNSGGGAMSWVVLFLLPFALWRRLSVYR